MLMVLGSWPAFCPGGNIPSHDMVACFSAEQTVSLRALLTSSVSGKGKCLRYFYLFLCPAQGLENQEVWLLSESCNGGLWLQVCLLTISTSPRCWRSSSWSSSQSTRSRWRSPSRSASCWRQAVLPPPPWCGVSQHWGLRRNLFLLFFFFSENYNYCQSAFSFFIYFPKSEISLFLLC